MNNQGRPTSTEPTPASSQRPRHEEPLIFEQGQEGRSGVDLPEPPAHKDAIGNLRRTGKIGLPGLSEPQVVRHYTRLSQMNYSIDGQFYPLGSCTMKHNPRLNEKMARLSGFAEIHPLQPVSTVQGALELIDLLALWLTTLTGLPAVALPQAAGAHGEFCGMAVIKAALAQRGESHRVRVLAPESAHGTNPATAAALGFNVETIAADDSGRVTLEDFKAKLGPDVAAIMLTNPNTCGLFERDIVTIAESIHEAGAYFYCDGANFNAIVGRVKPGDLGVDAMHINLHKTFSTPHGGGGPGAGPVVLSAELAPFAPLPYLIREATGLKWVEHRSDAPNSIGRLKGFHGQMGMYVRALTYLLSHGADGLWQVSSDAVLSANYLLASLKNILSAPFSGPCMHEALFDDHFLKDTGYTTLDIAKGLLDEGFHPMTMYFPLVVHGALLIEPTETESRETLDEFIAALTRLAQQAQQGEASLKTAPCTTPRLRLDETLAARKPVLRWKP